MALTVFLQVGVANASPARLTAAVRLEGELVALLRLAAPDADAAEAHPLHLAQACQALRDAGHADARPDIVEKLLRGMARDGRDRDGGLGNIRTWKASRETLMVTLQRSWSVIDRTAEVRWQAARLLLEHLTGRVPKGERGKDIQVETTIGDLLAAVTNDAILRAGASRT